MKRNAKAVWSGTGKEGKGFISTTSNTLKDTQYTYRDRFEDGTATNPEELMAAAHAACYSMKLSFVLGAAGFTPDEINTSCDITLEGGKITKSEITVQAKIPGITDEQFQECARDAKENCPVSQAYNMDISLNATLL